MRCEKRHVFTNDVGNVNGCHWEVLSQRRLLESRAHETKAIAIPSSRK